MTEGRVIHGRYRLLSKLGQGGMGTVWRAVHLELGTPVAVKLIDPAVADSKVALSRFRREAQSAASLRGTNVVQILDYGVEDANPYLVMELLEGESLAARISRQAPLSPQVTAQILGQVCKALTRAHASNIVHRDLKPDNIFIVRDGDEEVTKVLDFGIAKTMSSKTFEASIQTKSGAILGTPHYMSPEQASGRSAVDHRSDIWSLGVIAFECMTGCRPFNGSTLGGLVIAICTEPIPLPSQVATVPRGFDDWFGRCVSRDPARRFQSIADALASLRSVCGVPALSNPPDPVFEPDGREPTIQNNSRSPSRRTPFEDARSWDMVHAKTLAAGASSETVSAASRTLGAAIRRRPLLRYVALAVLLLGGTVAGALSLLRSTNLPAAASSSPSLESSLGTTTPAPSPAPMASLAAAPEAPASVPAPPTALVLPVNAVPVLGAARSQVAKSVEPATSAAKLEVVAPAVQGPAPTSPQTAPPVTEPATRPDPIPSEHVVPARRGNVEDRLAF